MGHLFQGRFKAILVERESHPLELIRYVALNPVGCGSFPTELREHIVGRDGSLRLAT